MTARDAGPSASKACLPGTRVALLSRIRHWALHPTSARTILLHGAAGKGKSAIANTMARQLQYIGLLRFPSIAQAGRRTALVPSGKCTYGKRVGYIPGKREGLWYSGMACLL
ncbi:hypothetical protein B0H14DRAFT_226759 [Mycena olivaceomarginata]|nr:hypothetical protein B0H14DRAFT_226759 [Mycena olivaceomarginata]